MTRLRGRFAAEATERVSALETSGDEVVALCNTGSLFGDARLVLVEDVDGRRNTEGRMTGGWKVADVKAVTEYLAAPAPATTVAFVATEMKKGRAAGQGVRQGGRHPRFQRRQEAGRRLDRRSLPAAGARASRRRVRRSCTS